MKTDKICEFSDLPVYRCSHCGNDGTQPDIPTQKQIDALLRDVITQAHIRLARYDDDSDEVSWNIDGARKAVLNWWIKMHSRRDD